MNVNAIQVTETDEQAASLPAPKVEELEAEWATLSCDTTGDSD